jgi:hypothetical protein
MQATGPCLASPPPPTQWILAPIRTRFGINPAFILVNTMGIIPSPKLPPASIGASCSIPYETVQPACHRKLGVSGWVCRRSGRDTNRRHTLLRAVPECGQVESWSDAKPGPN